MIQIHDNTNSLFYFQKSEHKNNKKQTRGPTKQNKAESVPTTKEFETHCFSEFIESYKLRPYKAKCKETIQGRVQNRPFKAECRVGWGT